MFKAVIFDLDGTLLDTIADLTAAGNHVLSVLGFAQHEREEYKQMVGNGVPVLVQRMLPQTARGGAIEQLALQTFMNYYAAHSMDSTVPYSGMPQALDALRAAGVRLGVVSNKENVLTQNIIARYFPDTFDSVCGHVLGTPTKPDPHLVNETRALFGTSEADTLYVGDSAVDVQTAHNARLACCGALWGFRTQAELEDAGAEYLAHTPEGLAKFILRGGE